ncbi:MAG: S-layer protein [Firmicutes bacterium]|nr:S-layer protein [Bacillota bacterium]
MKKRLAITLTLVLIFGLTGSVRAFSAATDDVPTSHWAYGAVKKLAADGIVDGSENGRFSGDKTLTRFEFAVIVARAMAKEDKATAEDKALLEKLAAEYKVELEGLGIRISALENRTDAVQISGTARVRFDQQSAGATYDDKHINIDINYAYKFASGWTLKFENEWQRSFEDPSLGNTAGWNALNPTTNSGIDSQMEQMYITGPLGGTTTDFGQFKYKPVYGLAMDTSVVGGRATFGTTVKTALTAANTYSKDGFSGIDITWAANKNVNVKAAYQQVDASGVQTKYGSLGLDAELTDDLVITAALAKSNKAANNKAYFSELQYKSANSKVVGSHDIFVSYRKIPGNAVYYTTKDLEDRILDIDFKGVRLGFDYVPKKNTKFTAWCMKGKDATTHTGDIKIYRGQMEIYF